MSSPVFWPFRTPASTGDSPQPQPAPPVRDPGYEALVAQLARLTEEVAKNRDAYADVAAAVGELARLLRVTPGAISKASLEAHRRSRLTLDALVEEAKAQRGES